MTKQNFKSEGNHSVSTPIDHLRVKELFLSMMVQKSSPLRTRNGLVQLVLNVVPAKKGSDGKEIPQKEVVIVEGLRYKGTELIGNGTTTALRAMPEDEIKELFYQLVK